MSRTEETAKTGTCARDRRAILQLVLNVHVKHSEQISNIKVTKAVVCVIRGMCYAYKRTFAYNRKE